MSKGLSSDCTNKLSKTPHLSHIQPPSSQLHVPTRVCTFDLEYFHYKLHVLPTIDGLCLQMSLRLSLLVHMSKGLDAASIYMLQLWSGTSWANCTSEYDLSLDRGASTQAR